MNQKRGDKRKRAWEFSFLRFPFIKIQNIQKGTNKNGNKKAEKKEQEYSFAYKMFQEKHAN